MANMRVIFLEDVPRVARAGEIKNVSEGYGRNYLLPRKLAVLASPAEMKRLEGWRQTQEKRQAEEERQLQELAQMLEGLEVSIKAKVAETGHLYGSVSSAEVAQAISDLAGTLVDRKWVMLESPLRQVGEFSISINLSSQLKAQVKVIVVAEEPSE